VFNVRRQRRELVQAHAEHSNVGSLTRVGAAFDSLGVADEDRQLCVVDGVLQLLAGPPGVHRDRDRPDRKDRGERDDPLRIVAHGDADAVARFDAVVVNERVTEGVDLFHHLGERPVLVFVHDERLIDAARRLEQLTQVRRCVLEGPIRDAVTFDVDHFERTAGSTHHGVRLLKAQSHRTLLSVAKY